LSKALEGGRKLRAFPSEGEYIREGSERRGEDVSVCVGISGPVRQQREEGKVTKETQREKERFQMDSIWQRDSRHCVKAWEAANV
jgi:hypothetical protein